MPFKTTTSYTEHKTRKSKYESKKLKHRNQNVIAQNTMSHIGFRTFQGGTSLVDHLCFCVLCFSSVHCCLVVTCWERADLLALVGDVYCICYFLLWYPGSGVVLDCVVS